MLLIKENIIEIKKYYYLVKNILVIHRNVFVFVFFQVKVTEFCVYPFYQVCNNFRVLKKIHCNETTAESHCPQMTHRFVFVYF